MSAFGSYANKETIDFTALGTNGLYLITGETGAGKTTIFDAISFALFGEASGKARDKYQMLRSDFANEKTKTSVELEFTSGSKHYHIKRTIKENKQEVDLKLPNGTKMNGTRDVTAKITEIIGLDRNQFAQIVMIAQNDFLRFLQSGTDERVAILRHIFGTQILNQFQEQLKTLAKQENDNRTIILHEFERHKVDVYKRNEQFAQWTTQIQTDKTELANTNTQLNLYDKQKQTLAAEIAIAEELCKKFTNLTKTRHDLDEHNKKTQDNTTIKTRATRGEIALHKVKPLHDEAQKTATNYTTAQTNLTNAKNQQHTANTELQQTLQIIKTLPPLTEAQNTYNNSAKEWETTTEKQKHLTNLQTNHKEILNKQNTNKTTQTKLTTTLNTLNHLPVLVECQIELDQITTTLKNQEEKLTKLSTLQNDLVTITNKQTELRKKQTEFEKYDAAFQDTNQQYQTIEEIFLRSQAGIIAHTLTEGQPCPVCGSTHHPTPAKLSQSDITETKLKKAKDTKEKAQKTREEITATCNTLKTQNETLTKRFVTDLTLLIPNTTIENATILLPQTIHATKTAIHTLCEKKAVAEKTLLELKTNIETLTKQRNELTTITTSLQSEIDTLAKRFLTDLSEFIPNTTWETSEPELINLLTKTKNTIDELTTRKASDKKTLDELSANWDTAKTREETAKSAVQAAQTLVNERTANEQVLLELHTKSQLVYNVALQENGFANEEDYKTALVTENELAALNKQVATYEQQGARLSNELARLQSETVGKVHPDMDKLRQDAEAVQVQSVLLSDRRDEINTRLSKTETALTELRCAAFDFEKSEKRYGDVKQLADIANGKLDFETFVQRAYFEYVLRAANQRLKVMSQNRYSLLRKTDSDDGRKKAGLDLEVLDAYTGKTRAAVSLSGGESFMASLSLALGLSDVVQQSAGGVRLDAMFIDEGFGSLDTEVLELAIRTLTNMAGGNRIIGIISHVAELSECIDKQVHVKKTIAGSKITLKV